MSERRDGAYFRKMRLDAIRRELARHMPDGVHVEKMILWIMVEFGLTRKKAEEYLKLVVETGDFTIRDGKIVPEEV